MKNIFKYLLLFTFVAMSSSAFAQKATKFGYINFQDLVTAMPEMDSAQLKLQSFVKELDANLETLNVELNKKYEAYLKEKETLTPLVRQTREGEIQDYQQRIQTYQESAQQEVQKKQSELYQPIINKAKKAVEDFGKENGFTMIFENAALQYMAADVQDVLPLIKNKLGLKSKPAAAAAPGKK